MTGKLTHFDESGRAHMVDVGTKPDTHRVAIAEGRITMHAGTLAKILAGDHRKGDVLGIARIAGIMGAKRTADLGMTSPTITPLPIGTFHRWLESRGKLGGQHKCPRCANHRDIVDGVKAVVSGA